MIEKSVTKLIHPDLRDFKVNKVIQAMVASL